MSQNRHIASVVLNYNSADDVDAILPQLLAQVGIQHSIIVVDNASQSDQAAKLKDVFSNHCTSGYILSSQQILEVCKSELTTNCYLVMNDDNRGYSAGNNVGVMMAAELQCDAILIVNPDIRIDNITYIAELSKQLFLTPKVVMAGSAIYNLAGENENPMQEPSFIEELLWPVTMLLKAVSTRSGYGCIDKSKSEESIIYIADKLSGSCFLISSKFLKEIDFFDEGVFLYCEESILSSRIKDLGLKIVYNGHLSARHMHDASVKGDQFRRLSIWSSSRRYFLENYSGYGYFSRLMLGASRNVWLMMIYLKKVLRR
ncbi:MAG: glycosyltransferase family 2 protein [Porticoccaceae bacterium]|nr:glycosyltransferase family 2 protein [Porticoccaceae bacterium]